MSLRLRLALWYGCFTGLVVLLVSLFTYATHSRAHYDDTDHILSGAVVHVSEESAGARTLTDIQSVVASPIAPDLEIAVFDLDGRVLAASPNAAQYPLIDPRQVLAAPAGPAFDALVRLAPPFVTTDRGEGAFGLFTDAEGIRWRAYVLPVPSRGHYVAAVTSLQRIDMSVERLLRLSLLLTALGAIATFAGGRLLAGRALLPVAVMTRTAAAIARSRDFRGRVPAGSGRDELMSLAATFNEMLGSLEQAYRSQQRFVSDASHELRAPLTAIQANLELIERQSEISPVDFRESVREANRETRRLASLVADLLALARADAGVPIRRQRMELDRVALSAFGEARHFAKGQSLEIGDLQPVLVEGDPDRLKQLCLILLDNALKYTPATGTVTLSVRRTGASVEVSVADTGVGISAEDLPHVFDRFFRADPARARDPGGTGLGLSIARWIAEQHGGSVTLRSQLGQGTQALAMLPAID